MREDKQTEKKLIINQWTITILYIVMIAVAIYSIFLISTSFTSETKEKTAITTYKQTPNISYTVNLKDNNFYDTKTLPMNKYYVTRIIDSIDSTFNYEFSSDHVSDLKYTYDITATLVGKNTTTDGEVEVWSKTYTILKPTSQSSKDSNSFRINENVKLDYKYYQTVVETFKSEIGLNIDAVLNVKLNVSVSGKYGSTPINETAFAQMSLPVGTSTTKVTLTSSNVGPQIIYDMANDLEEVQITYPRLIFGILLAVITLIGIAYATKKLINLTKKTEFTMEINKILKNYGDIIAESKQLPDYRNLEVMDIVSFQDMVDIEEELRSPIIFVRTSEESAWFIIIQDNRMYRYIVD